MPFGFSDTLGPLPSEQVHDSQFEELVQNICIRPHMYVHPVSYGAVCAYLSGFDAARSGAPLMGLQPWLVMRANGRNNWSWDSLASELLPEHPEDADLSAEERAIRALGRLLGEFLTYRQDNGLVKLFRDYSTWLLRRSWYTGPLRPSKGSPVEPPAAPDRGGTD